MDAEDWNARYATRELVWKGEPNRFLPPEVVDLAPGRAIDLACGEGRNALWLAARGWQVTAVDFAEAGVDKGRRLAAERGLVVDWRVQDLLAWEPPVAAFDLVLVFYLQLPADERRIVHAAAARALAPGAVLVLVAHDRTNLVDGHAGPRSPAVLHDPDEVVADLRAGGVDDLVVERAERVRRSVATDEGDRVAIDCLVRASRPVAVPSP
jgi:SAM-dependent methyltransferase